MCIKMGCFVYNDTVKQLSLHINVCALFSPLRESGILSFLGFNFSKFWNPSIHTQSQYKKDLIWVPHQNLSSFLTNFNLAITRKVKVCQNKTEKPSSL